MDLYSVPVIGNPQTISSVQQNHHKYSYICIYFNNSSNILVEKYFPSKNIKAIEYNAKGTATTKALRYAEERKINSETGRRPDLPHITLVITDGESFTNIAGDILHYV